MKILFLYYFSLFCLLCIQIFTLTEPESRLNIHTRTERKILYNKNKIKKQKQQKGLFFIFAIRMKIPNQTFHIDSSICTDFPFYAFCISFFHSTLFCRFFSFHRHRYVYSNQTMVWHANIDTFLLHSRI